MNSLTDNLKNLLSKAPDSQLDSTMVVLVNKWSTPPTALEILEVLDWSIFGSLASGVVIQLLQHEYSNACVRENTTHEEVIKNATWRKELDEQK